MPRWTPPFPSLAPPHGCTDITEVPCPWPQGGEKGADLSVAGWGHLAQSVVLIDSWNERLPPIPRERRFVAGPPLNALPC